MKTALVDLVSDALALGYLLKVTRRDGVIARYTTHDRDVAVGGATYSAGLSDLPSALQARSTLAVDNVTVDWLLDSDVVSKADLATGLWDDATVEVWVFDTDDLSVTPLKVFKGAVGEIEIRDASYQTSLRSLSDLLSKNLLRLVAAPCNADLGDTRCGVVLDSPDWASSTAYALGARVSPVTPNGRQYEATVAGTSGGSEPTWPTTLAATVTDGGVTWTCRAAWTRSGSVSAVTSRSVFTASGLDEAADWWNFGVVTFTAGDNSGRSMEVKDFASGVVTLFDALPYLPAASDTFTIARGCDKSSTTCNSTFANLANHRGFPFVPGPDFLLQRGTRPGQVF